MSKPCARLRPCILLLLPLLGVPGLCGAQTATVSVERENFRAIPEGVVVAELDRGAPLTLGEERERWRQATLEAWIWAPSLRDENDDGFQLAVSAPEGENLRASPNGRKIGRARTGMRLERMETEGKWVRVRRTAWIWGPSLDLGREPAAERSGSTRAASGAASRPAPAPAPEPEPEFVKAGGRGLVVLGAPSGDTLARVHAGRGVQVLAREGDWTRVRVEGWVLTGALVDADSAGAGVLRDVPLSELQSDPEAARGQLVEWTVQFIAVQRAEPFRTDFAEGEPFLLARGPGSDAGFVYIAIPSEREAELRALTPLDRFRVTGRVRTARSRLTDAPVIELLEIRPAR